VNLVCWLLLFTRLSTSYGGFRTGTLTHEQLCSHLRTISHNLSSVYTPSHPSVVCLCIILQCLFVLVIMVLVWLVCPKLQHDLQLALDHTRSYSLLHTPHKNQATAFFLQILVKLQPALPRENQITTVCISLNQTHPCSLHLRNRSQVVALGLQADTYSYIIKTGYLNRNPATICILTKLPKPKPSNSLYSPDSSTCIL